MTHDRVAAEACPVSSQFRRGYGNREELSTHEDLAEGGGAEKRGHSIIDIGARRIISRALSKTKRGPDLERRRVGKTAIVIRNVRKACACGIFPCLVQLARNVVFPTLQ